MSIFDFKRKKYRTFLQDSETGEEIAEEYEKVGMQSGKSNSRRPCCPVLQAIG